MFYNMSFVLLRSTSRQTSPSDEERQAPVGMPSMGDHQKLAQMRDGGDFLENNQVGGAIHQCRRTLFFYMKISLLKDFRPN